MYTTPRPIRTSRPLLLAALLAAAGCATRPDAPAIKLLSPRDGAVVPTLSDGQKAYLTLPRAARVKKFADPKYREKMKALGYYPLPLTLAWAHPASGAVTCAVEVVRLPDRQRVFATNFVSTAASESLLVDNLEIARPYEWRVTAGEASSTGHFTTEDVAPRLIRLPGVPNVRDLGGRVGLDGRRVKQGLVYRSAGLNENASLLYYTEDELIARDPALAARKAALEAEAAPWRALESVLMTNAAALPVVRARLSSEWTLFRPVLARKDFAERAAPLLAKLDAIPADFLGAKAEKVVIKAGSMHDFGKETAQGPAILMQEVEAPADGYLALSAGGDYWWELRANGQPAFDLLEAGNWRSPYQPRNFSFPVPVRKGRNLIAVSVFTGDASWRWGWNTPAEKVSVLARDKARVPEKIRESILSRVAKGRTPGRNRLKGAALDYALHTMGIRSDVDLRSDGECWGMKGSPLGETVTWFQYSSAAYGKMQEAKGREAFAKVFRVFLDEKNYPIDFHCIAGQDRTGAVAFILNGLLGVDEEELYRDWEATGFWNGNAAFNHARLFDHLYNGFNKWPGETINARIEAYVLDLGFTKDDIAHLRDIMLEK